MSSRSTIDRLLTGFLTGLLVPVLFFLIIYQLKYANMDFPVYVKSMWQMRILMKIVSLCVFPNLGFFIIFYRKKYDMAARGVIMATIFYALAVLIAKLI
jgi:hypothetical protein